MRLDVFTLNSTDNDYTLDTDGIAWSYDRDVKYQQVDGFVYSSVSNTSETCEEVLGDDYSDCISYTDDSGDTYYFWYPDNNSTQYLYETFGTDIISPIKGVEDEHFINWMRTAGLPKFRKLYGKIDSDFDAGDSVSFNVTLNFDVTAYGGTKSLVLTNLGVTGGKSNALGNCYIIVGSISLFLGFLFALKRIIKPRPLGDIRELAWN